ncbi:MAG: MBL fold metallo-hydrolase [Actinomycetota bacterium]|jgi:glyoxylase-like metal-dependent hydrolase (beta-lactamase superfamily II)/rhodanese-related sulfurtransferase|nr:MBL fold metallo-hydrolase [Actinomycetota bacterium]
MLNVTPIDTPELGDRSYVVDDGESAVVIDAQRDLNRVLDLIEARHLAVTHVAETHIHNDYLTGGLALANRLHAAYLVCSDDPVAYKRHGVGDGSELKTGSLTVRVMATPGHTKTHLAYVISDGAEQAVFTGGSLLYGATGRSDLLGDDLAEELARAQYHSAHRLVSELDAATAVYPTHGFGSFCAASQATIVERSTVGEEQRSNPALTASDEESFVRSTLAGLTPYPRYYSHMGYLNLSGPTPPDLSPPEPVDAEELGRRVRRGDWVIDLRSRRAFAGGHLAGSYGMELGKDFASYLGWMLPWGVSITLIGDAEVEVATAQRDLMRIGIDRVNGGAIGGSKVIGAAGDVASYRVSDFSGLADEIRSGRAPVVLDVRHDHEWRAGHVEGAVHIPFQDLAERVDDIPEGTETWVYCRTGHRASIAASLLERSGRTPVLVDDMWDNVEGAELPVLCDLQP